MQEPPDELRVKRRKMITWVGLVTIVSPNPLLFFMLRLVGAQIAVFVVPPCSVTRGRKRIFSAF